MVKSLVFVVALARGGCDQAPSTPATGSGSGGAVAGAAVGSAETKLGQTTLSPEARSQLDKLTGAAPDAPVKPAAKPVVGAKPEPAAKSSSAKPTLKPKPKWENYFPEYGPRKGAELMQIPDFEYNKDRWDYLSVRKEGGNTYYGSIYVEYRCDNKDGCERNTSYWRAIAWYLNG
jgi:hypothetical protein